MPGTLFFSGRNNADHQALWGAAVAEGWHIERLRNWQVPEHFRAARPVAVYGDAIFSQFVADQTGHVLLEPPIDWLVQAPFEFVGRRVELETLGKLRRSLTSPRFIKPADGKSFQARVYSRAEELPAADALPDQTPVLVQDIVRFLYEVRLFLLDGQIVTGSPYARDGACIDAANECDALPAEIEDQAQRFAQEAVVALGNSLPSAVVLDVGLIEGVGWHIVELNPAFASGTYRADPGEVLRVLQRSCLPVETLTDKDRRWVIHRGSVGIG